MAATVDRAERIVVRGFRRARRPDGPAAEGGPCAESLRNAHAWAPEVPGDPKRLRVRRKRDVTKHSRESLAYFREQYDREKSKVSRRVERVAFGQDVGGNGYTTAAQAERLSEALELSAASLLLDLGSGRGWPGTYLGWLNGCRFVLADLPGEALQQARIYAEVRGISSEMSAVRADGTVLPFRPHCFDAVVHADVIC